MAGAVVGPGWLAQRLAGAPSALAARTAGFATEEGRGLTPERLVAAGERALAAAIAEPANRRGALDLLAADALVTLALAAQVDVDPDRLGDLAVRLTAAGRSW